MKFISALFAFYFSVTIFNLIFNTQLSIIHSNCVFLEFGITLNLNNQLFKFYSNFI